MTVDPGHALGAVILTGGTGRRLGGVDKAGLEFGGRTLLEHALAAVAAASPVVVVGDEISTSRPVLCVREEPAYGGPAAAILAGLDALLEAAPATGTVAVLAVDMPHVTAATLARLHLAAVGRDGAVLTGPDQRRQLAAVLSVRALLAADPGPGRRDGLPVHRLWEGLNLAETAALRGEAHDVDTWADLAGP